MYRPTIGNLVVFCFLVLLGMVGRLGQPAWCVTPLAAIAMFSGFYFASRWTAVVVPLAAMVLSDLWLPAYQHRGVLLIVYAAWLLPVVLGRHLRGGASPGKFVAFSLLPATGFWLATNLAVWSWQGFYPATVAGLAECYAAAVPFYRMMLLGDLCYIPALFGSYLVARTWLASGSVADPAGHTIAADG